MQQKPSIEQPYKPAMPETSSKVVRLLFVMFVSIACLLIVLFVTDNSRKSDLERYAALVQGIVSVMPLQVNMLQYYETHHEWPSESMVLDAVEWRLPDMVSALAIDKQGVVSITFTEKVDAGGVIHLEPQVMDDDTIKWACTAEGIAADILPKECSLIW